MTPGRVTWQRAMSVPGVKFTSLFLVSLTECHQRQRTVIDMRRDEEMELFWLRGLEKRKSHVWDLGQGIVRQYMCVYVCVCARLVYRFKVPCYKITISPYEAGTQRAFSLLRLSFTVPLFRNPPLLCTCPPPSFRVLLCQITSIQFSFTPPSLQSAAVPSFLTICGADFHLCFLCSFFFFYLLCLLPSEMFPEIAQGTLQDLRNPKNLSCHFHIYIFHLAGFLPWHK